MFPIWKVGLFGQLSLTDGETMLTDLGTRKVQLLLALLVITPNQHYSRENLADLIWPESDTSSARNSLYTALSAIRKLFGFNRDTCKDILMSKNGRVWINADTVVTDVNEFETTLKAAKQSVGTTQYGPLLTRATNLYGRGLLPEYAAGFLTEYRVRITAEYQAALTELHQLSLRTGNQVAALHYAQKLNILDPYSEDACLSLMQLYEQAGLRGTAIQQYDALEQNLATRNKFPSEKLLLLVSQWRLTPQLQNFLASLSVFSDGWTLAAAMEVCQTTDAAQLLSALEERSLIASDHTYDRVRYRMIGSITRGDIPALSAQETQYLKQRHAQYYLQLIENANLNNEEKLDHLQYDQNNFRAALDWFLRQEAYTEALSLVGELAPMWYKLGRYQDGRQWIQDVLSRWNENEVTLAGTCAYRWAGIFAACQSDYPIAERLLRRARDGAQTLDDQASVASSINAMGNIAYNQAEYKKAYSLHRQALRIRLPLRDDNDIALSFNNLANAAAKLDDLKKAHKLLKQSLKLRKRLPNLAGVGQCYNNLGNVSFALKEFDRAYTEYHLALQIGRETGDLNSVAIALHNLGCVASERDNIAEAQRHLEESVELRRKLGDKLGLASSLYNLSSVSYHQSDYTTARSLLEQSISMSTGLNNKETIVLALSLLVCLQVVRGDLKSAIWFAGAYEKLFSLINMGTKIGLDEQKDYQKKLLVLYASLDSEELMILKEQGSQSTLKKVIRVAISCLGAEKR